MTAEVSLRDLLELESLRDARVVAGAAGLDRRVRHVNVMEVPDILRWVNRDELLLTTAYPLRDDPAALRELVPGLAARGLSGLAIKPARYIDAIPPELLAAADERAFPVIELPQASSFSDIINSVLTVILNTQAARLQRAADIHERFTAIVLGGGGLPQIAEALADSIGCPVAILDAQDHVQTATAGAEIVAMLRTVQPAPFPDGEAARTQRATVVVEGRRVTIQPIQVAGDRFGAIAALAPDDLTDDGLDAIEYAATIAALRQVQARVVAEADRRFQSVCLEELVTGHVERGALLERAAAFKWDLTIPRAVLVAQVDVLGDEPFARLAGTSQEATAQRRLADVVRAALGRSAIVWERSSEVAALAPADPDRGHPIADAGSRVVAEARRGLPEAILSIGVGRVATDPLRLAESFTQARRAIDVGRRTRGPGRVTAFRDLGVDRLLAGLPEAELVDFAGTVLAPLIAHDAARRTDLLATLEAYLETRNAAAAARRLWVHYNTMKNRLLLIEEVLDLSLDDPDRSLELAIALRIRRRSLP